MMDHKQLQEQYEDALFALMMEQVALSGGRDALLENKALSDDPDATVPDSIDGRCIHTIRRSFARQSLRRAGRLGVRAAKGLLLAAGVLSILLTGVFATSESVRNKALNLLVSVTEESTDFRFGSPDLKDSKLAVRWVPDGYTLVKTRKDEFGEGYRYQRGDEESIWVEWISGEGTVVSIDTEDAQVEDVSINGRPATLVEKNGEYQMIWPNRSNTAFLSIITFGPTRDEVLRIAQELEYE